MTRLYEQVVLVRPLPLDFHDDVMDVGSMAVVVDLVDDGVVVLEFQADSYSASGVGDLKTALATVDDYVPLRGCDA